MAEMTRTEHLQWCKDRALAEYDHSKSPQTAYASMVSDMGKHTETAGHMALEMGMTLLVSGCLDSEMDFKKFINDFG